MNKNKLHPNKRFTLAIGLALIGSIGTLLAFPPAPHHRFYGMVRNEYGHPIPSENSEIIFETSANKIIRAPIASNLPDGTNYRLDVPMDAGLNNKLHKPTAMRPEAPFRIRVRIDDTIYLPIEVATQAGSYMGRPGHRTLLNLTLGEDLDGDGLPDAWERSLLQRMNLNDLSDVDPNADSDGDGLSNLEEYISGSYAYDDENGFKLEVAGFLEGLPLLEFRAIRGRTYTLHVSSDLQQWDPVPFKIPAEGEDARTLQKYKAQDVRPLQIRAELGPDHSGPVYFQLMVQ